MSNGNDRTPVLQNEDWWACFLGWFILLLAFFGVLPGTPKIGTWTSLSAAFPKGMSTIGTTLILCLTMGVLTFIGGIFMKFDLKRYIPGFLVIFGITFISMVISKQAFIKKWGISYVLFALVIGLIISNLFKVPKMMKAAGQTEFFVKIGLVCMGATIMFSVVLKAGLFGVAQALLVATGSVLTGSVGSFRYPNGSAVLSLQQTPSAAFRPPLRPAEPSWVTPRKSVIWWPGCWYVLWC
jgi:hypothetical protein